MHATFVHSTIGILLSLGRSKFMLYYVSSYVYLLSDTTYFLIPSLWKIFSLTMDRRDHVTEDVVVAEVEAAPEAILGLLEAEDVDVVEALAEIGS